MFVKALRKLLLRTAKHSRLNRRPTLALEPLEERLVLNTYYWEGAAPGNDRSWSNHLNWLENIGGMLQHPGLNQAPSIGDEAVFGDVNRVANPNNAVVNSDVTVTNITILPTFNKKITIDQTFKLTLVNGVAKLGGGAIDGLGLFQVGIAPVTLPYMPPTPGNQGTFEWTGGIIAVNTVINSPSSGTIIGKGAKTLYGVTLTNLSPNLTWDGLGNISLQRHANLVVAGKLGAVFTVNPKGAPGVQATINGTNQERVSNDPGGVFNVNTPGGALNIGPLLVNQGGANFNVKQGDTTAHATMNVGAMTIFVDSTLTLGDGGTPIYFTSAGGNNPVPVTIRRANASNPARIIVDGLIPTSVQPYDSPDFRPSSENGMAATARVGALRKHFRPLKDPRVVGRSRHLLLDIIVLAICGVIGNCDDWPDIALFAQKREAWFRRFLKLPHGVPSHDTFERVFAALDARAFERCGVAWLREVAGLVGVGHIAIDGKTLCGSAGSTLGPLYLVSAWATQARLTLAQVAVDAQSNEITAIPQLLALLDLRGALVTIDAIGCQKTIAQQVVAGGGDYVLVVKGNQGHLLEDIQETVARALDGELPEGTVRTHTTREAGHGRHEERSCVVIEHLDGIRDRAAWKGLKVVGICCRTRTVNGDSSTEARYFIGSRRMGARRYNQALRGHWGIENNLHWQLDVSFKEDASRIENRHGAASFALLRKLALALLTRHPRRDSIARKRKAAALDTDFLAEILAGATKLENV
jgi:predicted transposase YbfD/YdcC